jgi:Na+-transporting NADH:ubiquinone oxidoreductase subunit NqrC
MGYGLWVMGYGLWGMGYGFKNLRVRQRNPDIRATDSVQYSEHCASLPTPGLGFGVHSLGFRV